MRQGPKIQAAIERLCSMKSQAQFTPHVVETWLAALSIFPAGLVNRAILEMACSQDPFPDCGKIVIRCQQEMAKRSTVISQVDQSRPTRGTINAVAEAFGIMVD